MELLVREARTAALPARGVSHVAVDPAQRVVEFQSLEPFAT